MWPARRAPRAGTVTATDAAKNFGALVDRVRDGGVAYVVERKGRPIARIAPVASRQCTVADLVEWLERRRAVPNDYAAAVADHLKTANRPRVSASRWPS
jgi:prevent-host-death family protein